MQCPTAIRKNLVNLFFILLSYPTDKFSTVYLIKNQNKKEKKKKKSDRPAYVSDGKWNCSNIENVKTFMLKKNLTSHSTVENALNIQYQLLKNILIQI